MIRENEHRNAAKSLFDFSSWSTPVYGKNAARLALHIEDLVNYIPNVQEEPRVCMTS
jgi:hypothetical protein